MSTVYNVITRYKVEDSQAKSAAQGLSTSFAGVARSLAGALFSVQGLLAGGLLTGGMGALAQRVTGLNSDLEQAQVGLATLFSVNKIYSFNDALIASQSTLGDLRADAAAGVGELADYLGTYQQVLTPLSQAGAGLDQVRELTRLAVAAGSALRGPEGAQLLSADIGQALTAGAGDRVTPTLNLALKASGMTIEAFNALAPEKKVTAMLTALRAFEPAVERQAQSWAGLTSTFSDTVKAVAVTATAPLFERWRNQLAGVNGWLVSHKAQIDGIAEKVGGWLVDGWDLAVTKIQNWREELSKAIPILTTLAALQITASGQGGALASAASGAAGGLVDGAVQLGRGVRWKGAAARSWAGEAMAGGVMAGGWKFSGVAGLAVGSIQQISVGLKALASFAAPVAKVLGAVAIPLMFLDGALQAFTANTFGAASWFKEQAGGLVEAGGGLLRTILSIFDNGILRTLGAGLLAIGGGLMAALGWVLRGVNAVLTPLAAAFWGLGQIVERGLAFLVELLRTGDLSAAKANLFKGLGADIEGFKQRLVATPNPQIETAPTLPAATLPVARSVTNIGKIEIHQKIEQDGSPDRVAWAWDQMLTQIQQAGRQARTAPVPMGGF